MNAIRAELLKLRRSAVWIIVVVLPLFAVVTGTVNYVLNVGELSATWSSYWSQVTLFYGLLYLSIGVAVLASTLWRMEHRGNWPRLLAAPVSPGSILTAKLAALALLVVVMQAVLIAAGWIAGIVAAGLPPALPANVLLVLALSALPAIAVAALQSLLSMLIRSFAAPVMLAVLGCVLGLGLMLSGHDSLSLAVPYALVTRVLGMLGALTTAAPLSWAEAARVGLPSLALAAAFTALGAVVLARRDIRA